MSEEVLSSDVFGRDDEGIDIRAGSEDPEAITSVSEDTASGRLHDGCILGVPLLGNSLHEDVGDGLDRFEDYLPVADMWC